MDRADRLAAIACQLAARIRDEEPAVVHRWLLAVLPDPADWFALCFVLGAAMPVEVEFTALTRWRWHRPGVRETGVALRPHGTPAAARRHRYHGEPPCDACGEAERERDRERKRAKVAA